MVTRKRTVEFLRALRSEIGRRVTQKKMSEQLSVSQRDLCYIEQGRRNPSTELLIRYAYFLHDKSPKPLTEENCIGLIGAFLRDVGEASGEVMQVKVSTPRNIVCTVGGMSVFIRCMSQE